MNAPHRPLVLVVDDDLEMRRGLHEHLSDEGFRVASAWNGLDALHYLQHCERKPSAILLDLLMPVMGGEVFLERLRASPELAAIPVIILSVRERPAAEVAGYMKKPFDFHRLVSSLNRVCAGPRHLSLAKPGA